jgi:hypothetical protein
MGREIESGQGIGWQFFGKKSFWMTLCPQFWDSYLSGGQSYEKRRKWSYNSNFRYLGRTFYRNTAHLLA